MGDKMITLQKDNDKLLNDKILTVWRKYNQELGFKINDIEEWSNKLLNNESVKLIQNHIDNNYNIIKDSIIIGHLIEEVYSEEGKVELYFFIYIEQIGGRILKEILETYERDFINYNKIAITISNYNKAKKYIENIIFSCGFIFCADLGCYIKE